MTEPPQPAKSFVVVHDDEPRVALLKGAIAAIGNFDGVHRGHRAVIDAALAQATALMCPAIAVTFEPHPRAVLRPADPVFRLTDERAKLRLLAATGLSGALVLTFDKAFAALSAQAFVADILVGRLSVRGATIGFDFHFGHQRGGSPVFLAAEGKRLGFSVEAAAPLEDEGRPVSSSSIRAALSEGRIVEAAELLGYPWFVTGRVIRGDQRGRDLGFPTANMKLDPACGLKHGIYAVRVRVGGDIHDGVASFGTRPTFDDGAPLLETFLFDFTGDLYGKEIDVAFVGWIRPELKFDSIDALVVRMKEDARLAHAALARAHGAFPPI